MYDRLSSLQLCFTQTIVVTVFWPFLFDFGQNIVSFVVLLWWFCGFVVVALWFCCGGFVVLLWWFCGFDVVVLLCWFVVLLLWWFCGLLSWFCGFVVVVGI
jgi:hypothetical protein